MAQRPSLLNRIGIKRNSAPVVSQSRSGFVSRVSSVDPVQMYIGYARAAILITAQRFAAEMVENLRAYDSNGKELPVSKHPMSLYFSNYALEQTAYDLFEKIAINIGVSGVAYLHLLKNEAKTAYVAAEVLPSSRVLVTEWDIDTGLPIKYQHTVDTGKVAIYGSDSIVRIKHYNPEDPKNGYSPVAGAGDHHLAERAAASHVKNHLYNNGYSSLFVKLKNALNAQQFEDFKRDFSNLYSGSANSGKTVFSNGNDVEIEKLTSALKDLDISAISKTAIDAILSSFGVSRAMLGLEGENLNRATAEVQERQFINNQIVPLMRRVTGAMDMWYKKQRIDGMTLGFVVPSVDSADEKLILAQVDKERAMTVQTLVLAGESLEEAKRIVGFDSKPAKNTNVVEEDSVIVSARKNFKSKFTQKAWRDYKKTNADQRVEDAEKALLSGMERYYNGLKSRILRQFKKTNAFGVSEVFVSEESAEIAAEIRPILAGLYSQAGKETLAFVEELSGQKSLLSGEFMPSVSLKARISEFIDRASVSITSTNSELISRLITDGLADEKTATQIGKDIDDAFAGQIERWRADRLAQTEAVRVNSLGEQDGVRQWAELVGAEVEKVWRTNSSDPCEFCRALNGTRVSVSDLFVAQGGKVAGVSGGQLVNTYSDLETPPIHPNCRCSVHYEVK